MLFFTLILPLLSFRQCCFFSTVGIIFTTLKGNTMNKQTFPSPEWWISPMSLNLLWEKSFWISNKVVYNLLMKIVSPCMLNHPQHQEHNPKEIWWKIQGYFPGNLWEVGHIQTYCWIFCSLIISLQMYSCFYQLCLVLCIVVW